MSLLIVLAVTSTNVASQTIQAISLRQLQDDLKACLELQNCNQNLRQFDGLTVIDGYVIDGKARDIILFGVKGSGPALQLEDFLVALRSAWHRYDLIEGNTHYFSPPGVSIDPRPQTLLDLQKVSADFANASDIAGIDSVVDGWKNVCRRKQDVQVFGVPRDSRAAQTMFLADYRMKRIVDGSLDPEIPAFKSLSALMVDKVEGKLKRGEEINVAMGGMTRFWFYPGETTFEASSGIARIKNASVVLLDEAQLVSRSVLAVAAGTINTLARKVSESFTNLYQDFSKSQPVYAELENLFRFVALTKIMESRSLDEGTELKLHLLLDGISLSGSPVDKEVAGIATVGKAQYQGSDGNSHWTTTLRIPSCGGVNIHLQLEDKDIVHQPPSGLLGQIKKEILSARPDSKTRNWSVLSLRIGTNQQIQFVNN